MARFFAVVEAPQSAEERFREALGSMRRWRFDKRGWVIKAFCNAEAGKIYVDAESPTRERFEQWLRDSGLGDSRIENVDLVFEEGLVWPMRTAVAV